MSKPPMLEGQGCRLGETGEKPEIGEPSAWHIEEQILRRSHAVRREPDGPRFAASPQRTPQAQNATKVLILEGAHFDRALDQVVVGVGPVWLCEQSFPALMFELSSGAPQIVSQPAQSKRGASLAFSNLPKQAHLVAYAWFDNVWRPFLPSARDSSGSFTMRAWCALARATVAKAPCENRL